MMINFCQPKISSSHMWSGWVVALTGSKAISASNSVEVEVEVEAELDNIFSTKDGSYGGWCGVLL